MAEAVQRGDDGGGRRGEAGHVPAQRRATSRSYEGRRSLRRQHHHEQRGAEPVERTSTRQSGGVVDGTRRRVRPAGNERLGGLGGELVPVRLGGKGAVEQEGPDVLEAPRRGERGRPPSTGGSGRSPRCPTHRRWVVSVTTTPFRPRGRVDGRLAGGAGSTATLHEVAHRDDADQRAVVDDRGCGGSAAGAMVSRATSIDTVDSTVSGAAVIHSPTVTGAGVSTPAAEARTRSRSVRMPTGSTRGRRPRRPSRRRPAPSPRPPGPATRRIGR